mgnify:CR=1 FL=1
MIDISKTAKLTKDKHSLIVYYPPGDVFDRDYILGFLVDSLKDKNYNKLKKLDDDVLFKYFIEIHKLKPTAFTTKDDKFYTEFEATKYSGKIFYGGMDLGYNINKLIENDCVESIDIYEQNRYIIELIRPTLHSSDKLNFIIQHPMKINPKSRYDYMLWSNYQYWLLNLDGSELTQQYLRIKYSNEYM